VMLGVKQDLLSRLPVSAFDSKVGRQAGEVSKVLDSDTGPPLATNVVIDLGNNSPLDASVVEQIFRTLSQHPLSLVVNARVPRPWQDGNNKLLAQMAEKYPQVHVADWYSASMDHRDYFVSDGVHLTYKGITAYVALIRQAYQN
jgi:hypothetical protein